LWSNDIHGTVSEDLRCFTALRYCARLPLLRRRQYTQRPITNAVDKEVDKTMNKAVSKAMEPSKELKKAKKRLIEQG
jgi:hypothetical protein